MIDWLAKKVAQKIDLGQVLDFYALKEEVRKSADFHAQASLKLAKSLRGAKAYLGSGYDLYAEKDVLTPGMKKKGYTKAVEHERTA